ncbi:DUF397 domain-containing protein [Actinomadura flavalba]|uniref:DUF397 domain-containing protein n=1 Tax=Actinomadura flavalba TaxID=1120938 RepID=UPI00037E6567
MNELSWKKSKRSSEEGDNCVEVANVPGTVAIRDTKNRDGGTLLVGRADFRRFADALRGL